MDPQLKQRIQSRLLKWYDEYGRDLPWRQDRDPYRIWVSEIMLQQTRVETAIPYYQRFMDRFPDAAALAHAELDEVLGLWKGLGYYSRAHNLHKGARFVIFELGGEIPADEKTLRKVPGIGDYTAGAVLSIAHNLPCPAVDGNVMRVLSRLLLITADTAQPKSRGDFYQPALELIPPGRAGDFNQAWMDLGAMICTPASPKCSVCPLAGDCQARQQCMQEQLPVKSSKPEVKNIHRAVFILKRDGKFLLVKKPDKGLFAGLWEFPGFDMPDALMSDYHLHENLLMNHGIGVREITPLFHGKHIFTHMRWNMQIFLCEPVEISDAGKVYEWFDAQETEKLPIPAAYKKMVAWVVHGTI